MDKSQFTSKINENLMIDGRTDISHATPRQLHNAVARAVMSDIIPLWNETEERHNSKRRAYYLSAEFLMGRAVFNNLYCAGLLDEAKQIFSDNGIDISCLEEIEDASLGNGGLGRLAACFLDSAAACDIPLNGYGIRYKYGLFKQSIENGFQREAADPWLDYGDAWSVRCDKDAVIVEFADQTVKAVPYDTPIIGYDRKAVNTLRLWQAESIKGFDFWKFDNQDYMGASESNIMADAINDVLYPNDNTGRYQTLQGKVRRGFLSLCRVLRSPAQRYSPHSCHCRAYQNIHVQGRPFLQGSIRYRSEDLQLHQPHRYGRGSGKVEHRPVQERYSHSL